MTHLFEAAQHLALVGPPGAGKSSVGQACAKILGLPLCDLDVAIAKEAGRSIAQLFANAGEAGFRAQEAMSLRRALSAPKSQVIACGGGTWIQADLRRDLGARCLVVCLTAAPPVLLARISADRSAATRPLLAGTDPQNALRALLAQRADTYALCPNQLDTTHMSVREVVSAVVRLWHLAAGQAAGVQR